MKKLPALQNIRKEMAERRLLSFIQQAWPVVEPGSAYVHGWHVEAIVQHLEAVSSGQIRRLLINIPPRHMKSLTVAVFWPCWEWIRKPEKRFLFASYKQSLSVRDNTRSRRLLRDPWYASNWGDSFQLAGDQNQKSRFENNKGGYRLATSVGSAVTGEGGDRIVVDDPHRAQDIYSQKRREQVLEWWDQVMSTRLNDPMTGAMVIIMQRLHEKDLSGHVLAQGGYEHLCLPAEYEGKPCVTCLGWEDPRREPGELLWPRRVDAQTLQSLKTALGTYGAAGQLQQQPVPSSGGVFKREWWRFYRRIPEARLCIQSWDTGFKTGENNAYSVGQTWIAADNGYYLRDLVRERLEYPELKRLVQSWSAKWNPQAILVEDKASGQSLVQDLQRGARLPLLPVQVRTGDKLTRAHTVSALVEAGKVFLPEEAPWLADFLDELSRFPKSAFADQVDALTQALHYLSSGKRFQPSGQRFWK